MDARVLREEMTVWRIGDADGDYPILDAQGASLSAGRWHDRGQRVIYTAEHYSTAMLEKLVYCNNVLPPNQHAVEITLPVRSSYEVVTTDRLSGWHNESGREARTYGHRWYTTRRSLLLIVPSVVARMERNVIINSQHADFASIRCGLETPVHWDECLFD